VGGKDGEGSSRQAKLSSTEPPFKAGKHRDRTAPVPAAA